MPELTVRQEIYETIKGERLTAREISQAVRVREREVLGHLEHLAKSHRGHFVVEPPVCHGCGFVFKKRERFGTPGRCPLCKSEGISETRYGIEEGVKGSTPSIRECLSVKEQSSPGCDK
ncbi:MAG: transcriptional regulator [Thermodesulfobacteriota bacterium]